jgi:hypothetical protein
VQRTVTGKALIELGSGVGCHSGGESGGGEGRRWVAKELAAVCGGGGSCVVM